MTYSNKAIVNFSGGEVDPHIVARVDLPLFNKVLGRMENFIAEPQGPARYRPGTRYVHHTRNNNFAIFIEFQFSDTQSYLIEVTEGYFRFYKDEGLILNDTPLTITGISKANPGVVTYTGTDPTNGQEVYIQDVGGMTEVNNRYFIVANVNAGANTFQLTDVFGNNINTTNYTTYTAGGTASVVYEIQTPYLEEDLRNLRVSQNADTMYIVSRQYAPRKLTRSDHDSWTLARYARTNDPIEAENVTFGTITGITAANPGVISDAAHTFVVGDHVYISGIVGMTQLNNRHFDINTAGAGSYTLKDRDTGAPIDTSAYTAWASGGIVEKIGSNKYPAAVNFTDGARLGLHGSAANPETSWYSRGPSAAGAVRFDDFTTGSNPNDALIFTLAPIQGKVDAIVWAANTDKYIALGTFGSIRRVFGITEGASIATDEITAKSANSDGVYPAAPVIDGPVLFYIARGGQAIESIEYDYQIDGYSPDDKNLVSANLTRGGLLQLNRQVGRPTLLWAVRADGVLLALTYKSKENIIGWHRHTIGGEGIVEATGMMPRENNQEQLWLSVQREINGNTVRYIEFMTDTPEFPEEIDFYTGNNDGTNDLERFLNYQSEILKDAIHLDASLTYNGNVYGVDAGASITMGERAEEEDAEDVIVTASAAVFTASMVGREIWGAYTAEGIGGGRLEITEYVSTTVVKGTITDTFPATATYDAGDWFITATEITGLGHLESETVWAVTDGAVPNEDVGFTVTDGAITLEQPSSVVHVGFLYRGILRTLPLDQGGTSGPAQSKRKIVAKVAPRFVNSAGTKFGTDINALQEINFSRGNDFTGRPVPLYNGVEPTFCSDSHTDDKILTIVQERPLPCIIASLDIYMDTSEE